MLYTYVCSTVVFSIYRPMALIVENTFTGIPYMAQLMFPGASVFPHFCFKNKVSSVLKNICILLVLVLTSCSLSCFAVSALTLKRQKEPSVILNDIASQDLTYNFLISMHIKFKHLLFFMDKLSIRNNYM